MTALVWLILSALFLLLAVEDLWEAQKDRAAVEESSLNGADREMARRQVQMSRYDVYAALAFVVAGVFALQRRYLLIPASDVNELARLGTVIMLFCGLVWLGYRIWKRRKLRRLMLR